MKIVKLDLSFAFGARMRTIASSAASHAHIAGVRSDASFALTENRMNTIVTFERASTAAGFALLHAGNAGS